MINQLVYIHDAGHGWLQVEKSELKRLNIQDKISKYSYMNGQYAYLEEDLDFGTYYNARKEDEGKEFQFREGYEYVGKYAGDEWIGRWQYAMYT